MLRESILLRIQCARLRTAGEGGTREYCLYLQYPHFTLDSPMAAQTLGCIPALYQPRRPADTPLYRVLQNHLETFLALCHDDWEQERVSPHAERELR